MKAGTMASRLPITQALVKRSCPICCVLAQFMEGLIEEFRKDQATNTCKTHTWALAKAAPGEAVVTSFLKTLEVRASDGQSDCGICARKAVEEVQRMDELAAAMQRQPVLQWLEQHGTFCLEHAMRLRSRLPEGLRPVLDQIVARNITELREQLNAYQEEASKGHRVGWGILGHAAEFLVGQRWL